MGATMYRARRHSCNSHFKNQNFRPIEVQPWPRLFYLDEHINILSYTILNSADRKLTIQIFAPSGTEASRSRPDMWVESSLRFLQLLQEVRMVH